MWRSLWFFTWADVLVSVSGAAVPVASILCIGARRRSRWRPLPPKSPVLGDGFFLGVTFLLAVSVAGVGGGGGLLAPCLQCLVPPLRPSRQSLAGSKWWFLGWCSWWF